MNPVRDEPVALAGVVAAVLAVAAAFGVHVTDDQRAALLGLVPVILAVAAWVRSQVTPVPRAADQATQAAAAAVARHVASHHRRADGPPVPKAGRKPAA